MKLCHNCQYVFDHWDLRRKTLPRTKYPHCNDVFDLKALAEAGCPLCTQFHENLPTWKHEAERLPVLLERSRERLNRGEKPGRAWVEIQPLFENGVLSGSFNVELCFAIPPKLEGLGEEDADALLASQRVRGRKDFEFKWEENIVVDESSARDPLFGTGSERLLLDPNALKLVDDKGQDLETISSMVDIFPFKPSDKSTVIRVQRNGREALPMARIWLNRCLTEHPACSVNQSFKRLPRRLIYLGDKNPRLVFTKDLVEHPKYVALSHCWGKLLLQILTKSTLDDFEKEIPLKALCNTYRDAFEITQSLGYQYTWIDSLCIVQDDASDWRAESSIMYSVYSGAVFTIAATSAADGNGGCLIERKERLWRHYLDITSHGETKTYASMPYGYHGRALQDQPLGTRAWGVQERLLSPRIIYFTTEQLFWECKNDLCTEDFPDGIRDESRRAVGFLKKHDVMNTTWGTIVARYTRTLLTRQEDKLVAISGIAEAWQKQTGDEYYAGLWRKDMELQLMWIMNLAGPRPRTYRAPSFSWAAVDGLVVYMRDKKEDEIYQHHAWVQDVWVSDVESSVRGAVSDGRLRLRITEMFYCSMYSKDYTRNPMSINGIEFGSASIYPDASDSKIQLGHKVYLVPVIEERNATLMNALILEKIGPEEHQYRRLGVARMSTGLKDKDAWAQLYGDKEIRVEEKEELTEKRGEERFIDII